MTDRLSALLHREASGLDVPTPPTEGILARGRRERRIRQAGVTVGVAAAAAVVTIGVVGLRGSIGDDTAPDPAEGLGEGTTFAIGNVVYLDGGATSATVDDKAVTGLYYTSAGVVVRHGAVASGDGAGPQQFSLVTDGGAVRELGLGAGETAQASDPDQPYLAYGENVGGELQAVVYDVVRDEEAARITVAATSASSFPVSLDGDYVYLGGDEGDVYAVDWRSGRVTAVDVLQSAFGIAGGRGPGGDRDTPTVVDVATGKPLITLPGGGYPILSPDGRYAVLGDEDEPDGELTIYDVASGGSMTVPGESWDWGWTADGALFRVDGDTVTTCSPATGDCRAEQLDLPDVQDPDDPETGEAVPACMPDANACEIPRECVRKPETCDGTVEESDEPLRLILGGKSYES